MDPGGRALSDRLRPEPHLTPVQVAQRAGLELETARRLWRALGMPDAGDDEVLFDDRDAEALAYLAGIVEAFPFEDVLTLTRVYGTALSRIADAEIRLFRKQLLDPMLEAGAGPEEVEERLGPVVEPLLDVTARLLDHAHRQHLAVALDAVRSVGERRTESLAAGFADLVDFSRISDDLPGEELGGLVEAFESMVVEICTDARVRLVKVIGDAVMFVSPDPDLVLDAARTIVRRVGEHEDLPGARAGLDFGDVVPRGGDYFGRPVNVAARITAFARPGTVVVSSRFLGALPDGELNTSRIGARSLKGVGRVEMFKVRET